MRELVDTALMDHPALIDIDDTIIGALVLEWSEPVAPSSLDMVIASVSPFLGRVVAELKRKDLSHVIPALINPTTPLPASDPNRVFHDIAKQARKITDANCVAIVYRVGEGSQQFRFLAIDCGSANVDYLNDTLVDYFGIPCQNMIRNDVYLVTSGVVEKYPDRPLLKELEVDSYLGFGFRNTAGETIGHIAFLHNRPMRASVKDSEIIRVIASKAGQELQRYSLERDKAAMNKALRVRGKFESLGAMSGTIAHDFNNQLTGILGNTELAALELTEHHPAQVYLKEAEQIIWRARDVVKEVMSLAGHSSDAPLEEVAIGEVISSVLSEFGPRMTDGVQVITDVSPTLPIVLSRRIQVFQIIANLMSNGLDALTASDTQTLKVCAQLVDLPANARETCLTGRCETLPPRCVCMKFKDSGKGMDAETAERIFDPYFSTKGSSRGLGLSSVLGIAKRLGLGMTFQSEPGVGTIFHLYFAPLEVDAVPDETAPTDNSPAQTDKNAAQISVKKVVLIVDDNDSVNGFVSKLFAHWGWEVLSAISGEDAVARAAETGPIDLAVVDMVMSGMNGIQTLDELRKSRPTLPAIIASGYSEDNVFNTLSQSENTQFLSKPFGFQLLKSIVDDLQTARDLKA